MSAAQLKRMSSEDARRSVAELTRAGMAKPAVVARMQASAKRRWSDDEEKANQARRCAKVTDEQVFEARKLSRAGVKQDALAAMFGVSRPAISLMVNGKTFAHVPMPE